MITLKTIHFSVEKNLKPQNIEICSVFPIVLSVQKETEKLIFDIDFIGSNLFFFFFSETPREF